MLVLRDRTDPWLTHSGMFGYLALFGLIAAMAMNMNSIIDNESTLAGKLYLRCPLMQVFCWNE
jgi:hypothetical protein